MNNDFLTKEHSTMTRWSDKDGEWLATYVEPELRNLTGLGKTPERALSELKAAYRAWADSMVKTTTVSAAVQRVVKEYGDVLRKLGSE